MKQKVALFKNTEYGNCGPIGVDGHESDDYSLPGYVRVSEWVVIDFPDIDATDEQVAAIDEKITELRAEFQNSLTNLERRKAELLAIPDLRAEAS